MENAAALMQDTQTQVQVETEEFKLEMLDCGPAYAFQDTGSVCFSCVCGSCLCGTPTNA
ncbi:hypothetical protein [Corallococcus caeni]|uniref:GE37468 family thiazolyl peptide n=1 Tax=Corallococcus caeni TaxID=3082388 RepID=A0ABQ6QSP7_9BACT|nr:hypothetical protein ASNO1_25660 [Corallococcus sp. NO1]